MVSRMMTMYMRMMRTKDQHNMDLIPLVQEMMKKTFTTEGQGMWLHPILN